MNETFESVDVLIIGAGLAGIGGACQLRRQCPDRTFTVLESRAVSGGTWDLFRYPGIRSDSDMYTYSYSFKPWRDKSTIADGHKILSYIREAAADYDVEQHIRYQHKVVAANWSDVDKRWHVTASARGHRREGHHKLSSLSSIAPAITTTSRAILQRLPAWTSSTAKSFTPSTGPRTWTIKTSAWLLSVAAPRPLPWCRTMSRDTAQPDDAAALADLHRQRAPS